MSSAAGARLNAALAVETDIVRHWERAADLRLGAAVMLSPRIEVAECLLAGVAVPSRRLDPRWVATLALRGVVTLDDELTLRVLGQGPLPAPSHPLKRDAA